MAIAHTNKDAYSSANITLNTNSGRYVQTKLSRRWCKVSEVMTITCPTAWEEVWDTGIATNANFQKGVGSTTNISWKSPKVAGTTIQIAYAPDNDGSSER